MNGQFREINSDLDSCRRFGNSTRSDAQALRRKIDFAQELQQIEKETQHRRDEQQGHRARRVKTQEGAQEQNRDHGANEQRCHRA